MGGIDRFVSGSPIYHGVPECFGRLLEPSSTGPRFGVDPVSGGSRRVGSEVANNCRSLRHSPQLPTPSLFLPPLQSHGSRHGCLSSGVGWPPGLYLSTFCADSPGLEQAGLVQGDFSHPYRSVMASEGVVSRAPEFCGGSSGAPAYTSRITQTAPLSSSAPEPPRAELSCVATVQRFARHLGLSRRVANQLSLCRHQSTRWLC